MSFDGKVILITGATSGIGAACAAYYAKEGAKLALVGRNAEKFERVVEKIKEAGVEIDPLVILADITVDAERIINETIEQYGQLNVLINNAGFTVRGSIETMLMDDYDAMMATNVRGLIELTKLAAPFLIETKGNIVNVSSCVGTICGANSCMAYSLTKAAVNYFTQCLAVDLAAKGVRVNAISPGFIEDTDFHTYLETEKGSPEYNAAMGYMTTICPIQLNGLTEDCVNAISFLTKDSSSFLTGVILAVDGGVSIKSVLLNNDTTSSSSKQIVSLFRIGYLHL